MNSDFATIKAILEQLRAEYAGGCAPDIEDPGLPITERDIVAEIRSRLQRFCVSRGVHVHCEIKPASNQAALPEELKKSPRVDIVLLKDHELSSWLTDAKAIQARYKKGSIETRFGSVPVEFFHTAIEVKIQSNVGDAKKDIDTLRWLTDSNSNCNCFFVLLNARGRPQDHNAIVRYAREQRIPVVEYTAQIAPAQQVGPPDR